MKRSNPLRISTMRMFIIKQIQWLLPFDYGFKMFFNRFIYAGVMNQNANVGDIGCGHVDVSCCLLPGNGLGRWYINCVCLPEIFVKKKCKTLICNINVIRRQKRVKGLRLAWIFGKSNVWECLVQRNILLKYQSKINHKDWFR